MVIVIGKIVEGGGGFSYLGAVIAACGRGASTVKTPSLDNEDRINSGFTPVRSKNARLYSRYTDWVALFSSFCAWT